MKKIVLLCAILMSAGFLYASECRNCGSDAGRIYRCNNCRSFFCDKCSNGRGKPIEKEYSEAFSRLMFGRLSPMTQSVVCPECGEEDEVIDQMNQLRTKYGNIRVIGH